MWLSILSLFWLVFHLFAYVLWAGALDRGCNWSYPLLLPKTIYNSLHISKITTAILYILYVATTPLLAIATFIWVYIFERK